MKAAGPQLGEVSEERVLLGGVEEGAEDDDEEIEDVEEEEEEDLFYFQEVTESPVGADAKAVTSPNSYAKARQQLQLSVLPDRLPCRDYERDSISLFLRLAFSSGNTCLILTGLPGTGKTTVTLDVVRELQKDEQMTSFTFVEINGMKLPTPAHAYSQLWHVLSKQHCSPPVACRHLTKHFARGQCFPCVVLLDELDMMMTRSQELVYNLLTWCLSRRAKLVLIGIANTIDLPERILPKVNSRQGTKHILFPAYRKEQLQEIVQSRLECIDSFDSEVVSVIARYVAGVSGDARKALQICRRAVDFAELQTEEEKRKIRIETGAPEMALNYKVGVEHVTMAINEMKSSLLTRGVQRACLHEKLFLCALMFEARITGVEEPTVEKVSGRHADLCHRLGINCPHPSALMSLCGRLCSSRILCLRERRGPADTTTSSCFSVVGTQDMFLPVALNMDRSTALFALQGDTRLSSILSLLA